jgi:sarcosine oxidase subunit gamma
MPEARTALNGVSFSGIATVSEAPMQGMITLRGDLSAAAIQNAATGVTGAAMPGTRGIETADGKSIAWMSSDEVLLLVPHAEVQSALAAMDGALGGSHALAVDVSDARAMFTVSGALAREVVAKLAPVDLDAGHFGPGEMRRSRLAQVPAAFWMSGPEEFSIICFRSVAQYVFDLLKNASAPGSAVNYLTAS